MKTAKQEVVLLGLHGFSQGQLLEDILLLEAVMRTTSDTHVIVVSHQPSFLGKPSVFDVILREPLVLEPVAQVLKEDSSARRNEWLNNKRRANHRAQQVASRMRKHVR